MPAELLAQKVAGLKRVLLPDQDADNSVDLTEMRRQNDLHLQGTLESIYQKYSRDFTEVGDEINILTGEVILDRGHVEGMRSELDDGTGRTPTRHASWIETLVVDDSDGEGLETDEDELSVRPNELGISTRAGQLPQEIISSTEQDGIGGTSSRPGSATNVSPNAVYRLQNSAPATSPATHHNIPNEPPPLDAVLESFKQSITQQWQSLVDSYFPTQMTPGAAPPGVQTVTPNRTPTFYTPARNIAMRTQPAGPRFLDIANATDASSSRSVPTNRQSFIPSERTGDVRRLRLRSPPGTESLWATQKIRKKRRPNGSLPGRHPQTPKNNQKPTPTKSSPRISSLLRQVDDSEDELGTDDGSAAQTNKVKTERENSATPMAEFGVLSSKTEVSMKRRRIPHQTEDLLPGATPEAHDDSDRLLYIVDTVEADDTDIVDLIDKESETVGEISMGTSLKRTRSVEQRLPYSIRPGTGTKRKRSHSFAPEQETSKDSFAAGKINSPNHRNRTFSRESSESSYRPSEERNTTASMESDDLQVLPEFAKGCMPTTFNAASLGSRSSSHHGSVETTRAGVKAVNMSSRSVSNASEARLVPEVAPRQESPLEQVYSSGGRLGRKKKRRSLLIQELSSAALDGPSVACWHPMETSLLPSVDDIKSHTRTIRPHEHQRLDEVPMNVSGTYPSNVALVPGSHGVERQDDPQSVDQRPRLSSRDAERDPELVRDSGGLEHEFRDRSMVHRADQEPQQPAQWMQADSILADISRSARFRKSDTVVKERSTNDPIRDPALKSTHESDTNSPMPSTTLRGLPRKSKAGRPPKPAWTVENDAKLVYMVTVQKLSWAAIANSQEFPGKTYANLLHHYYKELGGPLKKAFHLSNASRNCENCHIEYAPGKKPDQTIDPLCIACSMYARMNGGVQRPV